MHHLDEYHCSMVHNIRSKAIEHANKCVEDKSLHSAGEWMDIAKDAMKIIHMNSDLKKHAD